VGGGGGLAPRGEPSTNRGRRRLAHPCAATLQRRCVQAVGATACRWMPNPPSREEAAQPRASRTMVQRQGLQHTDVASTRMSEQRREKVLPNLRQGQHHQRSGTPCAEGLEVTRGLLRVHGCVRRGGGWVMGNHVSGIMHSRQRRTRASGAQEKSSTRQDCGGIVCIGVWASVQEARHGRRGCAPTTPFFSLAKTSMW
jgi:hypothetical protein